MTTLVIETATQACSVALIADHRVVAHEAATVGRGHAERLMPMIAALPGGGRAARILVDCGPGSFTGIRVGIAAARALGLGWNVPVAGYASLALIAATWFAGADGPAATVVIEGGHGEVFTQSFAARPLRALGPMRSVPYAAFVAGPGALIGNAAARFGGTAEAAALLPDAAALARVALPALPPEPLYLRGADARPLA